MKRIFCMLMTAVMITAMPGMAVCARELDLNPNMEIVQEDPVGEAEPTEFSDAESAESSEEEEETAEPEEEMLAGELPESDDVLVGAVKIKDDILLSNNAGDNEYIWNWAACMNSYLIADYYGGYTRVEAADDGNIYIEDYSEDLELISYRKLEKELPLFGGFYDDGVFFYLAFGQTNLDEDDNREVYRIVKYTRGWERLEAASVYGANTSTPFRAGSLRMDDDNGYLYVRTCHEMYTSSKDGLRHQANVTMKIRIYDMELTNISYQVQNSGVGYCSHSFNQFIRIDNGTVYALDHGDAYPRSAALFRYSGTNFGNSHTDLVNTLEYAGQTGDNDTGATLGGFEVSDYACLTAGSSKPQDGSEGPSNVYVTATSKSNFSEEGTELYWFTDVSDSGWRVGNPQLVEIDKNSYLLLWRQTNGNSSQVVYVPLDGWGRPQGDGRSFEGKLSDCQPIYDPQMQKVAWYVTDGYSLRFHTIDVGTWEHGEDVLISALKRISLETNSVSLNKGDTVKLTVMYDPEDTTDDKTVSWSSNNETVVQVDNEGNVKAVGNGTATVTAVVGDYRATARVTVKSPLTGISLSETSITMKPWEYKYVTVAYTPQDTTDSRRVTWKSDDQNVATVTSQGRIYAIGNGSTLIHATVGEFSASVKVTVDSAAGKPTPVPGPTPAPSDQWPFTDVAVNPGNWRYENVKYVNDTGIMTGVKPNEFQPDKSLTRAEFASVIYRMAGSPSVSYKNIFTDVPAGKWYSGAIIWAYENKIVAGLGNGRYGIDENITREQMARMLMEYAKVRGYDTRDRADFRRFADSAQVSRWADENMRWAVGSGIISGSTSGGKYYMNPKGQAKRVECAVMLTKFLQKYM